MNSEKQIEKQLITGLRRLSVPYRKAVEILREQKAADDGAMDQSVCTRLKPSMELIAEYEVTIAPLRAEWNCQHRKPAGELKHVVDDQAVILQELISLLNHVEQRLANSRWQLGAKLDISQRQTAMRDAYQS